MHYAQRGANAHCRVELSFFFSSRRRHTRLQGDWSSDVCSSDLIILVDHDAPAGKAGLREHDVVLQMNGQAIEGQDQIRRMLHDSPPGKTITLVISRDGQLMTVTTQMSTHEEVDRQALENRLTVPEPQVPQSDSALSGISVAAPAPAPSMRGGSSFIGPMVMNPAYTGLFLEKMTTQLASFF